MMGARIILAGAAVSQSENPSEQQMLLERIVRELKPAMAFIPSLADDNPNRREAHRLSRPAVADVPTVLAYETGSSSAQFAPTRFVDVEAFMEQKLGALTVYRDLNRPDLDPGYIQAAARHWGRHVRFGEAEAFEVLRDGGKDV
jgi:LmbE family N-acetylglucosaminyl deacetylase